MLSTSALRLPGLYVNAGQDGFSPGSVWINPVTGNFLLDFSDVFAQYFYHI